MPRLLSKSPIDAAEIPFPRDETTPPVIKINFDFIYTPPRLHIPPFSPINKKRARPLTTGLFHAFSQARVTEIYTIRKFTARDLRADS
jgi:hypothetical protein